MPLVSESTTLAQLNQLIFLALFEDLASSTFRAWVPGCATGEDAYALTMLLSQYVEEHQLSKDLRVIASETDEHALATARAAIYPASVRDEFSGAGLEHYFCEEAGAFRVVRRIRDGVLVSSHDLLQDPPFPQLNLIFCGSTCFREASSEAQVELTQVLHYSLAKRGFLLLTGRRFPEGLDALFSAVDRDRGVFQRRETREASLPSRLNLSQPPGRGVNRFDTRKNGGNGPGFDGALERLMLDRCQTACLVVSADQRVVYSRGKVGRFLQQPQGLPTQELTLLAKPQLRDPLRKLLEAPPGAGQLVRLEGTELDEGGAKVDVTIEAVPLPGGHDEALRAVVFHEYVGKPRSGSLLEATAAEASADVERLVTDNEELMSLNEELESANAELQSSQEQLQSVNEELETVNTELRFSSSELERVNGDLRNLIENTRIAALFLDSELCIRTFTASAQELFRFITADRGRPLTDIAPRFQYPDLDADMRHVLRTRTVRETQVQANSRWHLMRIMPYRTVAGEVDGLVVTFNDITEIKLANLEVKHERDRAEVRAQQQAIVAELGLRALDAQDLATFLGESTQVVCIGARAESCELTRLAEDGQHLELLASWPQSTSEQDAEPIEPDSAAAHVLGQREPVVLWSSQPFPEGWPARLHRQGVKTGARIAIRAEPSGKPFGVLSIYRRTPRDFSAEDLVFLQAIGHVLISAIQRELIEQARWRESQEAARRESERQIRRNERLASLGTFATGIAHELNNPLSNIVLSADYAAKTQDANRRVKLLETIRDNALRSGRIVESVLRFARDEATEKWPNDLNPLVQHAAAQALACVGPDKLNTTFELVEPSPRLNCNPTEMEQVFVNLLRNASEAQPGRANVRICSELRGQEVRIRVSDDGPGISPADLERIFDPFYSSQRAKGGTGLGLSITHRILATHGGTIRATPESERGAIFEIALPIAEHDVANLSDGAQ